MYSTKSLFIRVFWWRRREPVSRYRMLQLRCWRTSCTIFFIASESHLVDTVSVSYLLLVWAETSLAQSLCCQSSCGSTRDRLLLRLRREVKTEEGEEFRIRFMSNSLWRYFGLGTCFGATYAVPWLRLLYSRHTDYRILFRQNVSCDNVSLIVI